MRLIDANFAQHLANISLIAKNAQVVTWVLAQTPTIEAEPVRHGRWVKSGCGMDWAKCSKCNCTWEWEMVKECNMHYCPNCGAKMDLED